jgi:MYXO-CTERM domain-containing protein
VSDLGAPVVSAPAPAGDYLVVATFDGTVRAMVAGTAAAPGEVQPCDEEPEPSPPGDAGCCGTSTSRDPRAASVLAVFVLLLLRMRRRREPASGSAVRSR